MSDTADTPTVEIAIPPNPTDEVITENTPANEPEPPEAETVEMPAVDLKIPEAQTEELTPIEPEKKD